jgi:hypothetical protein
MFSIASRWQSREARTWFLRPCNLHPYIQRAGKKQWLNPKPRIRAKFDEKGEPVLPSKVTGYTQQDLEQLRTLMKTSIIGVPEDQKPEVAQRVNHSFL